MNETTSTIPMPGATIGGDAGVKQWPGIQVNPGVGIDSGDAVPAFSKDMFLRIIAAISSIRQGSSK